ncbi:type I secretion system ATPase [Serratia fonticola]|uniref:Type I secretion system ATPase n=2 Tax=Serratia fonticola TaxID=47917 RepID=A0A4U9USC7_SERFO|nr:type I secretion system ATPase [Serratia fonticola]
MHSEKERLKQNDDSLTLPPPERVVDTLLECTLWMCEYQGSSRSAESLCAGLPKGNQLTPSQALSALNNAGLTAGTVRRRAHEFSSHLMPIILLRKDRGAAILLASRRDEEGKLRFQIIFPEIGVDSP